MDKARSITIFDVAQASGVSYSTVSRVLNGFQHVKADTRKRVLEAAQDLGYTANLQARSLAGGKSKIIGVLVPSLDNSYITAVCHGIDQELASLGYDLMLFTTHRKEGKENQYVNTIANGLSDGLLLMVPLIASPNLETSYLKVLREKNFPYVLIDQTDSEDKSSVVDSNNWQGAYEAIKHLINLGHKRIGFTTGVMAINAAKERLDAYKAALKAHDIEIDERFIIEAGFDSEDGYIAAQQLLSLNKRPSAIFASNDLSAFGVMDAIRNKGLSIPEDISIIGFDDIPQASVTYPKLTTVKQPLEQMGREAVKLLLEQIEQPEKPVRRVTLATALIKRDSCQALT